MKIDLKTRFLALAIVACVAACSGTTAPAATGSVSVAADVTGIQNNGTAKATVTATVVDAKGNAGTGALTFSAPYGDLNGTGTGTATATLDANGVATATFACSVATDTHCAPGSVLITATWGSLTGAVQLAITGPSGTQSGGGDGGITAPPVGDGGVAGVPTMTVASVFPAFIVTAAGANPAAGLPGTTTVSFALKAADGTPMPGQTVNFMEPLGQSLVTLGATSAVTSATGIASVTVTSKDTPGRAQLLAVAGTGQVTATAIVPILGPPSIIAWVSTTPDVLGIKGSGIQEHGLMTFQVTDALGTPVPQAQVTFTQATPSLVTIDRTPLVTDDKGQVVVTFSAGNEVGVSSLIAKVTATGATSTHPIAVRGAKPSGSGFYFRCDKANLPVYTTTTGIQTVTCTVRLTDRSGNRIGVPVPVSFATEAGAINASVTTKGFDFSNPTSADEGTATVTFTTDLSDGHRPVDVTPIAGEPSVTAGGVVYNPRDQLVTIIAMTQGEEGFIDANHNGQFDPGENFIDQGDPFVDANDDGVWQTDELRFCGSGDTTGICPTYQGPNGAWDSLTTIWKPTWVVFTGPGEGTTAPAGGAIPTPPCADFIDSPIGGGHSPTVTVPIYLYDFSLNPAASGTVTKAATSVQEDLQGFVTTGFGTQLDQWGAMGLLGFDFDYKLFAAGGGPCVAGSGACVEKLVFNDFDQGLRGFVSFSNSEHLPSGMTGNGCAPNANGQPIVPVPAEVVSTTNGVETSATLIPIVKASSAPNGLRVVGQAPSPSFVYTSDGTSVGLVTSTTLTFQAFDASGAPLVGKSILFSSQYGSVVPRSGVAVTDATGTVSVLVDASQITDSTNECVVPGAFTGCEDFVTASLPYGAASATTGVPIRLASSAGVKVMSLGAAPSAIYPLGGPAGLPTSSVITFGVIDASGNPVAGVPVSFGQDAFGLSNLLTLTPNVGTTDATGHVTVTASAQNQSGTEYVTATLPNNIASTSQQITVTDLSTISIDVATPAAMYTTNTAGLPTSTSISARLTSGIFGPGLAGITVSFAEASGETLLTGLPASAVTDSGGRATIPVGSTAAPGTAHVVVSAGGVTRTAAITIIGSPSAISMTTMSPTFLGLQGSGILQSGTMTFSVTDAAGSPVPGVSVDFSPGVPALVTLSAPSAVTDSTGSVVASYSSGNTVGVSTLTATIRGTSFSTTQSIAVRGAKPSASGLYFRCSKVNLGAYDTTLGVDTTTCTVRLSDRFGNRVGVPTAISFATEAGSISATAVTQGFSFSRPTDPNEGTATVTFTTDMGNGFRPVDVTPLAGDGAQVPFARSPEPSCGPGTAPFPGCESPPNTGGPTLNPRDQLVTIIAMVRGEEAFTDNNLNGVWDSSESFVDQGDPFVDANDNGVWDSSELRFCGSSDCALGTVSSTYHSGNGTWDSDRIIWAPTWVVFSGAGVHVAPATLACVNYASSVSAGVYALDRWLNTPVTGTSLSATLSGATTGLTVSSNFVPETEVWGSLGFFGYDFDYVRVAETCTASGCVPDPTRSCASATGATSNGCMQALLFYTFDDGQRGVATVKDGTATPATPTGGACTATPEVYSLDVAETGSVAGVSFRSASSAGGTAAF